MCGNIEKEEKIDLFDSNTSDLDDISSEGEQTDDISSKVF